MAEHRAFPRQQNVNFAGLAKNVNSPVSSSGECEGPGVCLAGLAAFLPRAVWAWPALRPQGVCTLFAPPPGGGFLSGCTIFFCVFCAGPGALALRASPGACALPDPGQRLPVVAGLPAAFCQACRCERRLLPADRTEGTGDCSWGTGPAGGGGAGLWPCLWILEKPDEVLWASDFSPLIPGSTFSPVPMSGCHGQGPAEAWLEWQVLLSSGCPCASGGQRWRE